MKHLKTFENYTEAEKTNEFFGGVRKFATGHESKEAKLAKKAEIEGQIEQFATSAAEAGWSPERIEQRKIRLLKAAADNNWRGYIKNGQYKELWTDLEALGAAAAGAHSGYGQRRPE